MKLIILIAVTTSLLLELSDALPKSSVGGPMAMMMIVFLAVLALGLYEAWSQKRGVLGWLVSIVASVVGGFLGAAVASVILEILLSYLKSGRPPRRVAAPAALYRVRRHDAVGAAGIVDRVTDREPVPMMRLVPKLIPALKTSTYHSRHLIRLKGAFMRRS